jgi:acetoacetyl-CoA synthetase
MEGGGRLQQDGTAGRAAGGGASVQAGWTATTCRTATADPEGRTVTREIEVGTELWRPGPERLAAEAVWELVAAANQQYPDAALPTAQDVLDGRVTGPQAYAAVHAWSVAHAPEFWAMVWDVAGVPGDRGERLVETGAELQQTRFLPDARLNVAQALLARRGDDPALLFVADDGETAEVSWDALHALVARLQRALRAAGVRPEDRVAAIVSNRPEAYALMIATVSLGATFTSVSPDFGTAGILDRFAQVAPVVLVGVGRYSYAGKDLDCTGTLTEVADGLAGLKARVLANLPTGSTAAPDGWVTWADWTAPDGGPDSPEFERFGIDQPMYVLYSSGTTGRPKCIVHRAGGILLKHLAEHRFTHSLRPGDRLCYFTTAGWMMWNWLASGLACGATLVLYDGSPFHPDGNRLFDLVDSHRIAAFGTSPRFLDACAKAGLRPRDSHHLDTLRTIFCTGSPLSVDGFGYVYDAIKRDVALQPISGGTDLCGVLIGPDPLGPVPAGQMPAPALGVAADVVDDDGTSTGPGERGELVVRGAFPSMPLRFWGDPDGSRYRAAYFERFPGMWHHGDYAERTREGGYVITGRSDATLNPGGVRIGTAEIYRQVAGFDEVVESLAIGQPVDGDVRVVLFVQLRPGLELDDELRGAIRARIRANLTPRHVPALVLQAPDLPRTRSGKLSEIAVRDMVAGRSVANTGALANPECLDFFADVPDLTA